MKRITATQWVEQAKSADKTRFNLNLVYRDSSSLVATDGHRLHLLNGLPSLVPHFVGSMDKDLQFPDYKQVLPTTPQDLQVKMLRVQAELPNLIKLAKFGETRKGYCPVKVTFKSGSVTIELNDHPKVTGSIQIQVPSLGETIAEEFGCNLCYLIDAIRDLRDCKLNYRGNMSGLEFIGTIEGQEAQAIVMPMKLQ